LTTESSSLGISTPQLTVSSGSCSEPRLERLVAEAYLEPDHDLSFEYVTFAVRGDTVVGMVSAYSSEQHCRSSDGPLKRAAGWRIIRLGAVNVLTGRLLGFLDDIGKREFYLQAVAVDADSRGQGPGTALFQHAQNRAMNTIASRLALHVSVENIGAR
jgi:ribosomal protein S18 acetylase RimI-like enzyme